MGTNRSALGARGEDRAVRYLESLGYSIIERNYHCKYGEIDIVARDGSDLVLAEVKTRRGDSFGAPSEAVDIRKQKKLILAGQSYMIDRDLGEIDCRFDVIEVYFTNGQPVKIDLIKGAFSADY
ncbi:MAG: YraN family protein [Armatimonadota bacterium]